MTEADLFGYLARRFGAAPETRATEALIYVLTRSAAARTGLLGVCAIATRDVAADLEIRPRPANAGMSAGGVVGVDRDGAARLVLRPMFWGGLPDSEPVADLRSLLADQPGVVVVVAPAGRFTPLWATLRRRCRLAGLPVHGDHAAGDPVRWTRVGARQTLILISWTVLLAGLRSSVVRAGETALVNEIDQLASLCSQIDSDAFLPLETGELATVTPRRLQQFLDLLDELASACERRGIGRPSERDVGAGQGTYSRTLRVGRVELVLAWSVPLWATLRETPFWLQLIAENDQEAAHVEARLRPLGDEIPPRLLRDPVQCHPLVPLFPLAGVEREAVVADLVGQVEEVARLLDEAPTIGFGSATGSSA